MSNPLHPQLLEEAYRQGIFPMADRIGRIRWYAPNPRTILSLDRFHLSRRLARTTRQQKFTITINRDFSGVIRGCADRGETWISPEIIEAYTLMHHQGLAHSIEAYHEGQLAGGLYGVCLGGAFMAESMFTLIRDASKVCLAYLVRRLIERGFILLDIQYLTPHLEQFGAIKISRDEYLHRLEAALKLPCQFD